MLHQHRPTGRAPCDRADGAGRKAPLEPVHFREVLLADDVARHERRLDLPFRVLVEERLGAGDDHPVSLRFPESEYLKVRILRRWDG